jgi:translation initiation factor eIF-2B subunit gamma
MNRIQVKNMVKITIPDTCEISPKSQIGSDCLLGDGTVIAEKSSIKRSIIGNHVNIGKHCKVTNCVIMDYVVIEDGVKLDNCILCRGARISQRCELKDSEVAGQYKVPADTHAKNEHLIPFMVDQ